MIKMSLAKHAPLLAQQPAEYAAFWATLPPREQALLDMYAYGWSSAETTFRLVYGRAPKPGESLTPAEQRWANRQFTVPQPSLRFKLENFTLYMLMQYLAKGEVVQARLDDGSGIDIYKFQWGKPAIPGVVLDEAELFDLLNELDGAGKIARDEWKIDVWGEEYGMLWKALWRRL